MSWEFRKDSSGCCWLESSPAIAARQWSELSQWGGLGHLSDGRASPFSGFSMQSFLRASLCFCTAWQFQGSWAAYLEAQAAATAPVEQGGVSVYDLDSEIIQGHFYCVLLVTSKSQTCPNSRGGKVESTSWWWSIPFLGRRGNGRNSRKGAPLHPAGHPSTLHSLCPYSFNPNLLCFACILLVMNLWTHMWKLLLLAPGFVSFLNWVPAPRTLSGSASFSRSVLREHLLP